VAALKWFNIANVFGPAAASMERLFGARQITPGQAAEGQTLAREWLARQGKSN
jgi:hypothetical protein